MQDEQGSNRRREPIVFGQPVLDERAIAEVVDTLRSGWVGAGPKTAEFERRLGDYLQAPLSKATSSCTASLHLALVLSGIGPGHEVITTPLTFASTANVIIHTGARPVFADVDRRTMNLDPDRVEQAITPRTRALLLVHLAGRPCDLDAFHELARQHGLVVIEDAAHALGAFYRGSPIGGLSDFAAFSFYPTKNLTTGEGGLLTGTDPTWAERVETLIMQGLSAGAWRRYNEATPRHYEVVVPGYKYNMTDIQASLGLHQVDLIDARREARARVWQLYDEALAGLPMILPPPPADGTVHARHLYTPLLDLDVLGTSRDHIRAELQAEGVTSGIHFVPLHRHHYYRSTFGYAADDFPDSTWIGDRTLSLPLSPHLTTDDAVYVADAVRRVLSRARW